MGKSIGYKLPKVELIRHVSIWHTITFSYLHNITALNIDWTEEMDTGDYRLANSTRDEKRIRAGFRFTLDINFTDQFLIAGSPGYDQDQFEYKLNELKTWLSDNVNDIISVYPYQDRTDIHYPCRLVNYIKTPISKDGGIKTICHDYQIGFRAISLVSALPKVSSMPWDP